MTPSISSLLIVFGLWLTLALLCCGGGRYTERLDYKVTYRVDGKGVASLTYRNQTGGTEQHTVELPWTLEFDGRYGEFLYLSAQNKSNEGAIVASIIINGRIVKDAISTGDYGIATVSDRCCKER